MSPLKCQHCGAELPPDAPGGVCPYCVLQLGGSQTGAAWNATAAFSSSSPLPTIEQLTALFPQLEILEQIGHGGMGVVFKARQPSLDRLVALKILLPDIGRDPAFAERFSREARALARLSHPHIVAIYDSGEVGGLFYLVMEYVDGVNLRQALQAEQISPDKALAIVPQICEALQYAHEEGVVHRDIKPENVLLDRKGRVKVADFGLAKLLGLAPRDISLTGTSQAMGTLHYMAPEQYEKPQSVDHRADIYSLGVVFYELLTGKLPLGRFALPSEKVQIDVRLDHVVLKTLEREPERRYQYVSDVKTEMDSIAHSPAQAAPQRPHDTVFAASRALHAPPPRREISDVGRLFVILGMLALATMPLLCVGSVVFAKFGIFGFASGELLLLALAGGFVLLICGVMMIVGGLTQKRPEPAGAVPPEKAAGMGRIDCEQAERAVRGPALALLILAAVNFALAAFFALLVLGQFESAVISILVISAVKSGVAIIMALGAMRMRHLQSYGLAMTAAILAILPVHVFWLLGLPLGIWALAVLCRSDVRKAFHVGETSARASDAQRSAPAIAIVLAVLAAMMVVPVLLVGAVLLFGYSSFQSEVAPMSPAVEVVRLGHDHGRTTETVSKPEVLSWVDDKPQLNRAWVDISGMHELQQSLNEALATAHSDYLKVEKEHTRRTTNELGHQVVTVRTFPKDLTELEDAFWTKVDAVVTDDTLRGELRRQIPLNTLFPFGKSEHSIEIWKVGAWYSYRHPFYGQNSEPTTVPELPPNAKRFWQPPAEKE